MVTFGSDREHYPSQTTKYVDFPSMIFVVRSKINYKYYDVSFDSLKMLKTPMCQADQRTCFLLGRAVLGMSLMGAVCIPF